MDIKYNKEFYIKFKKFVNLFMKIVYKIEINGKEYIPEETPCLFAGNHLHILDSWLLMYAIEEPLRFMVDKKLYKYKIEEYFLRKIGTFPINPNEPDINSVITSINLLKNKENIVIFPEGKTHKITESIPFKKGVASIAKLSKSSLIPFGITGNYSIGSNLTLTFGKPIDLSLYKKDEYDKVLENTVRKLEMK